MNRKNYFTIGVAVLIALMYLAGYFLVHQDAEAVGTMTENNVAAVEAENPVTAEEDCPKPVRAEESETSEAKSIEELDVYMYTTAIVNMREGYTIDTKIVDVLPYGTKVHVTGIVSGGNWYRVEAENEGYILGRYLSSEEPEAQE